MALKLSAEQKSVLQIFGTEVRYLIPNYQRPYSWDIVNCRHLWEDLFTFFASGKYREGYFLGNIVLAKSPDTNYFEVIDGQQRLITLTLLIKAISLFDINNKALQEIMWIPNRRNDDSEQRLKSAVFEDKDNENLFDCLKRTDTEIINKKDSKFHANLDFFIEQINTNVKDNIVAFSDFILDNIFILPIESDDIEQDSARENALIIFETINNRGLDLSDADIFKAQLYTSSANISKQNEFIIKWNILVERVEDISYKIDDVFRIYMHIIRGINKDIDSEIGLRQFFTSGYKYNKPLKKLDYVKVFEDLEKIVYCLEYYYQILNLNYKEEEIDLVKWFQIIDAYSNSYPKFALFIYLFKNGRINNKFDFELPKYNISELNIHSKNIIKYVYSMGATAYVKFKIYDIIKNTFLDKIFDFEANSIKKADFEYYGRIRKGLILIYIYLNKKQKPIKEYKFDTIQKTPFEHSHINLDSPGNYILVDKKSYSARNKNLDIRKEYFRTSDIIELNEIALKISDWNEKEHEERQLNIENSLFNFFYK
ncbi:DUF262 domain-containing protein [Aliarcobacter cryaerophilus]|uniref:DUF262 domain-containing protein n=1 Tax=Aliarcobacter cryaerophilus TaxID=28198 RepID=UPI003DA34731